MSDPANTQLCDDWRCAVDDAGLAADRCILFVLEDSPEPLGQNGRYLQPGSDAVFERSVPLRPAQVHSANEPENRGRHRVVLFPPEDAAARLGLLRYLLEFARQYEADSGVFQLGMFVTQSLSRAYSQEGPGSASVLRVAPMTAAAATAAARLVVRQFPGGLSQDQLWGPYGGFLRVTSEPLEPGELGPRVLVWAALHEDAVEGEAEQHGGMEATLREHYPAGLPGWRRLLADGELQRLARAARLSVPGAARIAASREYPAAVWNRTIDLLDRGLVRGGRILANGVG